jgi:hypothetical protein
LLELIEYHQLGCNHPGRAAPAVILNMRRFFESAVFNIYCLSILLVYYVFWKFFLSVTLPALLAGILGFELVNALPPGRSIPAALTLAAIVALACSQWRNAESLRARLEALEQWRESQIVYVRGREPGKIEEAINPS